MFSSGFFNAKNHDKQYTSSQLSNLFNSLLNPGVFENVGNKFVAKIGTGMEVIVQSGMAWFNSTWSLNDADYVVAIDEAPYVSGYSRIDGIFLKCYPADDTSTRDNSIYYAKGTETSATPEKPVPESTDDEVYKPICYVTVAYGTEAITASMIENCIGTDDTPFITGILETASISDLLTQWQAQWDEWITSEKEDAESDVAAGLNAMGAQWSTWFESVKTELESVDVGDLREKVDALTGMFVQNEVLYLPNTAASVTSDGTIVLGSDLGQAIEGGDVRQINVGGVLYRLGADVNTTHVGQIIITTTLDTEAKMQAEYGEDTSWTLIQGRTLVGAGTGTDDNDVEKTFAVGETGGEYEHTLTVAEMPAHSHTYTKTSSRSGAGSYGTGESAPFYVSTASASSGSTGSGTAHNIMNPYYGVYMWLRTA